MPVGVQNFAAQSNYKIAATTASQNQSLTQNAVPGGNPLSALRIANNASAVAWARWGRGTQTAVTTTTGGPDTPVLPGEDVVFAIPAGTDNCAVILESGTGNVYLGIGDGS